MNDEQDANDLYRTKRLVALRAERDEALAQLTEARELLADVWQQFAVPGKDGRLWAGGLSTLEAVDKLLHPEPESELTTFRHGTLDADNG